MEFFKSRNLFQVGRLDERQTLTTNQHILSLENKFIPAGFSRRESRVIIRKDKNLSVTYYSHWKGVVWGVSLAADPLYPRWNTPGQWILSSWSLDTRTDSMGSTLGFRRLVPKERTSGIELGGIIWLKLIPDVCVVADDRRERAQSESWVVNLSQNTLWLCPLRSDKLAVPRSGWLTEASEDAWLLRVGLSPCRNVNCFPAL